MPPDDVKLELTRDWLVKVADDLQLAERALSLPPLPGGAMFHCQQAAEKALKAYLTWHDRSFRNTHNVEELRLQCADVDPSFDELVSAATVLSPYAARSFMASTPISPLTISLWCQSRGVQGRM